MRHFELSLLFPRGSVLVGGYSPAPTGFHGAHARDRDGRAIIPATAVRGALRTTLEALLRGAGEPACAGGNGHDPTIDDTESSASSSAVSADTADGCRCKACLLFGTMRKAVAPGERWFSGLVLGDAQLAAEVMETWVSRPGVAIDRRQRSARDKLLFFREVPMARELRFVATGRLRAPELETYLTAAVAATTHVGAGKSRGLAQVELALRWLDAPAATVHALPPSSEVRLRVTLRSAASIGVPMVDGNYRESRMDIPGSALRGAVGFALAEAVSDPDNDTAFQALVAEAEQDGAHFGFLHAVEPDGETAGPDGPLPITAAACKVRGRDDEVVDTLLDRLAVLHAGSAEQAAQVERDVLRQCVQCGAALRGTTGSRKSRRPPPTRAVTRLSMDRRSGSARDEQLFTQVLLDAGATFQGSIRRIPPGSWPRLQQALTLPISLGRGRSSGWGQVDIELLSADAHESIAKRGNAFVVALRQRLDQARLGGDRAAHLVPVTLLSPLLAPPGDDGSTLLREALGAESCFFMARRFVREGGWDQRSGTMRAERAVAAGGVFVLDLGTRTLRDVIARLEYIEEHGVGARRHQGYGQVICFDPFILHRHR